CSWCGRSATRRTALPSPATVAAVPRSATPAGSKTSRASDRGVAPTCSGTSAGWAGSRPPAWRKSPAWRASTLPLPNASMRPFTALKQSRPPMRARDGALHETDRTDPAHPAADAADPGAGAGVLPAVQVDQRRRRGNLRLRLADRLGRRMDRTALQPVLELRRLPRPGCRQADGGRGADADGAG